MSEVVVVGSFTAREGREAEAMEAFKALVEPTHGGGRVHPVRAASGCDDPRRLAFVERWSSRELLSAHLASPHVQQILERADELFGDSGDIVIYEALPEGEHKKGSLAAHAGGAGGNS